MRTEPAVDRLPGALGTSPPGTGLLPGADFVPAAELATHRQELWGRQREKVAATSPFLREAWAGVDPPERLDDLPLLPMVDKSALRADQREHGPFGRYLAAEPTVVARVHRTGGTTGEAMNLALSAADAAQTAIVGGRAQHASGLGPGHRVVHCLNYMLWMGGYTDHASLEATGATVVPFGVGGTELLVRTIRELAITAISCTPSYPAVLEQVVHDAFPGLRPRDLGLRLGLFGGEAGLDDSAFRARLERTWGFAVRNSNYGVTDVICNTAGQCTHQDDLHLVGLDVLHAELVDPDDGAVLPWEAGTTGELVLTHLARECQPLVRFRTGDVVVLTSTEPCACGRTAPRLRVVGRSDDMVVIRGVNVFPSSVTAVVNAVAHTSGEYRIRLVGPPPYDRLPLEVELSRDAGAGTADLAAAIAAEVGELAKRDLRVTAAVTVVAHGTLPRSEGKTRRVVREP
ncbi:MAG: AMP-binding protein [Candidatus Nanopelagicales bacterium]